MVEAARAGRAQRPHRGDALASSASICPSAIRHSPSAQPGPRLRHRDGGLRHVLQLLHRADRPAAARSAGRPTAIVAEVAAAGRARRPRDHAARPDRERLRPPRRAARADRRGRHDAVRRRCSRRLDAIPGIERIRYTSPHPLFFDEALIARPRRARALCPHVHLPVQSGSDRMLAAHASALHGGASTVGIVERAARGAARPGPHHRPDRRLSGRDRGRLRGHPRAGARRRLRRRLQLQVLAATRHRRAARAWRGPVPPEVAQERLEELQDLQRALTLGAPPRSRRRPRRRC